LLQAQSAMTELMTEFYCSVTTAEEAASALIIVDELASTIEICILSVISGMPQLVIEKEELERQVSFRFLQGKA
jgi:hypothetical protein